MTFFGTFYAKTQREILRLEGTFLGSGHNVEAEVLEGVVPTWEKIR